MESVAPAEVKMPVTAQQPVDITSREFKAQAVEFYARLRREAPVYRTVLPDKMPVWIIARYDDVAMVLKDDRFSKEFRTLFENNPNLKPPWVPKFLLPLMHHMLHSDPPNHTRLRALVQQAFKPSLVERLRPRIAELATELLAAAKQRKTIDLVSQFALPIPATIIAEMLGVPANDRHKFHRWTTKMIASGGQKFRILRSVPVIWRFNRYLHQLVKAKRAAPQNDLLNALLEAEEAGDKLSEDELVAMMFLLLVAGHETTVNLIASGMLALLDHPDQMQRLRQEPSLIKTAVEELLRFTSPVETGTERYTKEDVTIAGVTIPRGSLVLAAIASANRDEQHFSNPDQLDIAREPNKHLSFGLGPHFCLGAPLARLEAQIAFTILLEQTTDIRLATAREKLTWNRGIVLRGVESLPLEVKWR
ncbi:MAG TPA: cytochrome P450 [Pirellulales bacterium]|jgi:cytochrome P450 PksS|nr:cytochrome P450 [Pirellulales bacterium]